MQMHPITHFNLLLNNLNLTFLGGTCPSNAQRDSTRGYFAPWSTRFPPPFSQDFAKASLKIRGFYLIKQNLRMFWVFPRSCSDLWPVLPPSNLPNAVFTCVWVLLAFHSEPSSTFSRCVTSSLQARLSKAGLILCQALAAGWMTRDLRKPLGTFGGCWVTKTEYEDQKRALIIAGYCTTLTVCMSYSPLLSKRDHFLAVVHELYAFYPQVAVKRPM